MATAERTAGAGVIGVTAHPLGCNGHGVGVQGDSICWRAHIRAA
jgi:hypothetical protein